MWHELASKCSPIWQINSYLQIYNDSKGLLPLEVNARIPWVLRAQPQQEEERGEGGYVGNANVWLSSFLRMAGN